MWGNGGGCRVNHGVYAGKEGLCFNAKTRRRKELRVLGWIAMGGLMVCTES